MSRSKARRKLAAFCSGDGVGMTGSLVSTAHGTIGRFLYSSRLPSLVFFRSGSRIGPVHRGIFPSRRSWYRLRFCSGLILMEKGARFWSSAKVERWKKRRERLICERMNVGKSREKQKKDFTTQEELGEIDLRSDFNFNLRGRRSFK